MLIAVYAGYDGDIANLFAFLNQLQIFTQLMSADISYKLGTAFGGHVRGSHPVSLHHDLLFKE